MNQKQKLENGSGFLWFMSIDQVESGCGHVKKGNVQLPPLEQKVGVDCFLTLLDSKCQRQSHHMDAVLLAGIPLCKLVFADEILS